MKSKIKVISIILSVCYIFVGCSSKSIDDSEKVKIKNAIDIVLSSEANYAGDVVNYCDEETFYESNYTIFYSYFIGQAKLSKYESELVSVEANGTEVKAAVVLNMVAEPVVDGSELQNSVMYESEGATGDNVPVEVVLKKKDKDYYVVSTKEYDSLEDAQNNNKLFKKS